MNRISNVIVLAAVASVATSAFARSMVAEKPRVEVRPGQTIEVRPTVRTAPAETTLKGQATTLEQLRQQQPAVQPPVTFIDEKGNSCNAEAYSTKLSNGTSVSYASTLALVKGGWVKMGTCGSEEGGLLGYSADARETLLLAMQTVANSVNGRAASQLSTTERVQAKIALREGLALAKNRNGGNKYSAASEAATAEKIMADEAHGGCSLVPAL